MVALVMEGPGPGGPGGAVLPKDEPKVPPILDLLPDCVADGFGLLGNAECGRVLFGCTKLLLLVNEGPTESGPLVVIILLPLLWVWLLLLTWVPED